MRRALRIHAESERGSVVRIEADIRRRRSGALALSYELTGHTSGIRIPPPAAPSFADGLWRRTCFEAFVGLPGEPGYLEFNLSPSGRWGAYRFSAYRDGMTPLADLPAPEIALAADAENLTLTATLDLAALADPLPEGAWRIGLAAVIEDADGRIGYWALAHPAGKPDFHHADGFACEVRASEDA